MMYGFPTDLLVLHKLTFCINTILILRGGRGRSGGNEGVVVEDGRGAVPPVERIDRLRVFP